MLPPGASERHLQGTGAAPTDTTLSLLLAQAVGRVLFQSAASKVHSWRQQLEPAWPACVLGAPVPRVMGVEAQRTPGPYRADVIKVVLPGFELCSAMPLLTS